MKTNTHESSKGLPEIAQIAQNKKMIFLFIGVIILIIVGGLFLHSKSQDTKTSISNEVYSPQAQNVIEVKKEDKIVESQQPQKPQITPEIIQAQFAIMQEKQKELQQRLSSPLMIVNNASQSKILKEGKQTVQSNDPNTQFLNQLSHQQNEIVSAVQIGPLNSVISEGSLIHAILESATDSDLPGSIRASVSEANFSEDGSQVLIPPGSRLIGQYKSGMIQGQSRIYIVWSRLITPEGISINLGSPGVDNLGVAGMGADEIDRHFWQRFGTASLLSIIGAGAANNGVSNAEQDNSAAVYRAAVASSFAQSAEQSLEQESMIAPTLKTYQGKPVMVFVSHDIHFEGVINKLNPKVKVF